MAELSEQRKTSETKTLAKLHVFNLEFNDELNSHTCGELVIGIIKHILYQRGQIPETFEGLLSRSNETSTSQVTNVRNIRTNIKAKKVNSFVETFQELFDNLRKVFFVFERTRVRRVALVFGSTPVNPKELHCIEIPPFVDTKRLDADCTSSSEFARKCLMLVIRNLVSSARDVNFADLQVTNVTVLMEMSCCSNVGWFVPKTAYSDLPKRGRHFRYVLSWTPRTENHSQLMNRTNVDIVNSRPFTVYESPAMESNRVIDRNRIEGQIEEVEGGLDLKGSEDDFMWFQMPVVIKGLSIK